MLSETPRLKVATIVGTRPELIRLSRVIAELDRHCDQRLIHTGQNYDYELNQIFFDDLGIRAPDAYLDVRAESAAEAIANVIARSDRELAANTPDAVLVLGDTNSCMAALAAKRRKIPVFHMEAGNRCFDMRVPEEINRRIVDHIADINLTYSTIAREYLLREGLSPDRVIKTGSPMLEVLTHAKAGIDASDILTRLDAKSGQFFIVSAHREENVDPPEMIARLGEVLNRVAETFGLPVIMSTHPRTKARIESSGLKLHPLVRMLKPLGFHDYIRLQREARAVLSDSGTITEESSILGFPALNIREAHERPEGMEEAAVMMVGLNPDRVLQGLTVLANQTPFPARKMVADYAIGDVSAKVVRLIHSYVDYVNRTVWSR